MAIREELTHTQEGDLERREVIIRHLEISAKKERGNWSVSVWNDRAERRVFFFQCNNEDAAMLMVDALKINYKP